MKTVKFILIAAFVSFAMMSYSTIKADVYKPDPKISINKAMMDRGLLDAMNLQISEDLIDVERDGYYFAKVKWDGRIVIIYGKLKDWEKYFRERKWVSVEEYRESPTIH